MDPALLCVLLLVTTSFSDAVNRQVNFLKTARDDVIFTDSVLSTLSVKSMLSCVRNCLSIAACVTFTLVNRTVTHECRLHNEVMTSNSTNAIMPGAVTFSSPQRELRGQPCGTASECVGVNWECFKGQCLCSPGYYYSLSSKECIPTCPVASMQSTYTKYTDMKMRGCNIEYRTDSIEECKMACYLNTNCLTFEYDNTGAIPNCFLQNETPLTSPSSVLNPFADWDLYQKHCV